MEGGRGRLRSVVDGGARGRDGVARVARGHGCYAAEIHPSDRHGREAKSEPADRRGSGRFMMTGGIGRALRADRRLRLGATP